MKYFRLIRAEIPVADLLAEVRANEQAALFAASSQEKIVAQQDANAITLRAAVHRADLSLNDNHATRLTDQAALFPQALAFMQGFAAEKNAELSRASILRIKPQTEAARHIDEGAYYALRDRYHLVLHSTGGSILVSGDEQVRMQNGDLWWFDNRQHHETFNATNEWRIHYVFDLLPLAYKHLAINPLPALPEGQATRDVTIEPNIEAKERGSNAQPAQFRTPHTPPVPWALDTYNFSLDDATLTNIGNAVGYANRRFRESVLRTDLSLPPYLFNVQHRAISLAQPAQAPTSPHALLDTAIRERAILRAENGVRLISPNGGDFSWMIDMRRVFMDAQLLNAAADLFWDLCGDKLPFQVGGMEVAAIPIVAAILMKGVERGTPINGFMVRKERKLSGEGKTYEGILTDDPIIIVDDVLNSGTSLEKIRAILAAESKSIRDIFVVIDYHSKQGLHWRGEHNLTVTAPFALSDFALAIKDTDQPPLPTMFVPAWDFASPDPNFSQRVPKSFPATDGERIYFGSDCGFFWCLNAATGDVVWKVKTISRGHKNIWSSPALHDGKVFFGSYDGNVYCLDGKTGAEIWRYEGADWVGSSPALAPELGLLFIGLEFGVEGKRGSIVALNIKTGKLVWEHKTKRYTHASPAYWPERQVVACGSNDDEMFLFDAKTGAMRWRFQTDSGEGKGSIRHAPAFDTQRGYLVTGCANGTIYILDVETGREVWSVKTDNTIYTVPLVVGDFAYIGSTDKYFYILDLKTRSVPRRIYASSKIFAPPSLIEGSIYFSACSGVIYKIDPTTHAITGMYQLPDSITCAMTYSPTTKFFYALTYVNQIFALKTA